MVEAADWPWFSGPNGNKSPIIVAVTQLEPHGIKDLIFPIYPEEWLVFGYRAQAFANAERQRREREHARFNWGDFPRGYYTASGGFFSGPPKPPPAPNFEQDKKEQARIALMLIIGVDTWTEGDLKLVRRAQRKAHPDTGGNHELWLSVRKLAETLGIK